MSAGNVMRFLQIWKLFWSVLRWKGEKEGKVKVGTI